MTIAIIVTIGVVICVGMICYASIVSSKNHIIITKLKHVIISDYAIDHNFNMDSLKSVLHEINTILCK